MNQENILLIILELQKQEKKLKKFIYEQYKDNINIPQTTIEYITLESFKK